MKSTVTEEKLAKYFETTSRALDEARKNIANGKKGEAEEIIEMVSNYLSDARHFQKNKDLVDAFAALNYAHGWLDSGARLGIFNVKDDKLFTVK